MSKLLLAALLAAWPGVAAAAEPPSHDASVEAMMLIQNAGAPDLFEDASRGNIPAARHVRSGLVCTFEPGVAANQIILPQTPAARGDDVACNTIMGGVAYTLYVTRFPVQFTSNEVLKNSVIAIKQMSPGATAYKGAIAEGEVAATVANVKLPKVRTARLVVMNEAGAILLTKVDVAQVAPWTVRLRTTGLLSAAAAVDQATQARLSEILTELVQVKAGR